MPVDYERHARLFYDPDCGPCRFFAGTMAGLSRGQLEPVPFTGPLADAQLGDLPAERRYASAHWVEDGARRSGTDIVRDLVGTTFGPTADRLFDRLPALARPLEWAYRRLWQHRQRHGCTSAP